MFIQQKTLKNINRNNTHTHTHTHTNTQIKCNHFNLNPAGTKNVLTVLGNFETGIGNPILNW